QPVADALAEPRGVVAAARALAVVGDHGGEQGPAGGVAGRQPRHLPPGPGRTRGGAGGEEGLPALSVPGARIASRVEGADAVHLAGEGGKVDQPRAKQDALVIGVEGPEL